MELNFDLINRLGTEYNEAYYLLDTQTFTNNYQNLLQAFQKYYSKTNIAYSYKTNYIPRFCSIVNKLGGYAEIVSSMELEVAKKIGVDYKKIYFNGPYKDFYAIEDLLINGGIINVDSLKDFEQVILVANKYPQKQLNIGVRINFNVGDGVVSRFGFDVDGPEINQFLDALSHQHNVNLIGVHTHFAQRSLKTWENRLSNLAIYIKPFLEKFNLKFISLGGGMYGNMHDSLKKQFADPIPSFKEYAEIAAKGFSEVISQFNLSENPELLIEPGSALAGDAMKFCAKIYSIKKVDSKNIATVKGSIYNINPTLNKKNPPISVFSKFASNLSVINKYDIAGYTCIESDYLYKDFEGNLHCGDYIVFSNVGSYSIVFKPPFILPNFSIIELTVDGVKVMKRQERFDDLFKTYNFEE